MLALEPSDALPALSPQCRIVVAIPACNEAARIEACLAAFAAQRDRSGAPLQFGRFAVLVFANNCADDTAARVTNLGPKLPFPVIVVARTLPALSSNAGMARRAAMELAAEVLERSGRFDGVIATTDADSRVCSTWIDLTLHALDTGVDGVAGYIEAEPAELLQLGDAFCRRGRLEDRYLSQIAELYAVGDPLAHDPWPNHRVSSGASLAVTLRAYRAIGGLPAKAVGEDAALTHALAVSGFRVRHAMEIVAVTSCRFDGRAAGGAADTMRLRHAQPDTVCDNEIEPVSRVVRRALWKGGLRRWHAGAPDPASSWSRRLALAERTLAELRRGHSAFEAFWDAVSNRSESLARLPALRPSALAAEIERASVLIERLRGIVDQRHRPAARTVSRKPETGAHFTLAELLPDLV